MSDEQNSKAGIQFLQDRFDAIDEGNDYAGSPAWDKNVYHNNNFPVPFVKFWQHNISSEHTERQMRILIEDYWAGRDTCFVTACENRLGLSDDDLLVLHDNGECPLPIERYGKAMYERGIDPYNGYPKREANSRVGQGTPRTEFPIVYNEPVLNTGRRQGPQDRRTGEGA